MFAKVTIERNCQKKLYFCQQCLDSFISVAFSEIPLFTINCHKISYINRTSMVNTGELFTQLFFHILDDVQILNICEAVRKGEYTAIIMCCDEIDIISVFCFTSPHCGCFHYNIGNNSYNIYMGSVKCSIGSF